MKSSDIPVKIPVPWATNADGTDINDIPLNQPAPGYASFDLGWPPEDRIPIGAGGFAPRMQDDNGITQLITRWLRWVASGAPVAYDSTFQGLISGYPKGAVVKAVALGNWWMSTVDDNPSNPETGGANWIAYTPFNLYATDHGTKNAGAITLAPPPPNLAFLTGRAIIVFKMNADNDASYTLNVNGLGVTPVILPGGSALPSGTLPAASIFTVVLDPGGNFEMQNGGGSGITPGQLQLQSGNYAPDTGPVNHVQITLNPAPASMAAIIGAPIRVLIGNDNTIATPDLQIGALAAVPIRNPDLSTLARHQIVAGMIAEFIYDGTRAQLMSITQVPRIRLEANTNFYVATTGSDANDGLSVARPFLTLQHAWAVLINQYDLAGFNVTVNVADGTYTAGVSAAGRLPGADTVGSVTFQSSSGNAAACVINSSGACFVAGFGTAYAIQNFKLVSGGNAIDVNAGGQINHSGIIFGTTVGAHMFAWNGGRIYVEGNYSIIAGGNYHLDTTRSGLVYYDSGVTTVTLTGTPAFSTAFAFVHGGQIFCNSNNVGFSGGATGTRYTAEFNGGIDTNGGGPNFFPGTIGGGFNTGGQYG